MATPYKLPLCWFGQPKTEIRITGRHPNLKQKEVVTTFLKEDIQPGCQCDTPQQAFLCMTGHLTECHVGKDCATAQCSHHTRYIGGEV